MPFNTPSTIAKPLRRLLTLASITFATVLAPTLPAHAHGEAHRQARRREQGQRQGHAAERL